MSLQTMHMLTLDTTLANCTNNLWSLYLADHLLDNTLVVICTEILQVLPWQVTLKPFGCYPSKPHWKGGKDDVNLVGCAGCQACVHDVMMG